MNDFVNPFLQYDEEGRQDFDLGYLLGQDVEPFIPVAPAPVAPVAAPAPVAAAPAPAPAPAAPAFQLPAGWSTTYMGSADQGGEGGGSTAEEQSYRFDVGDEALLRSLGFEGPVSQNIVTGEGENLSGYSALTPEAQAFLEQGGYRLAGKDIGDGRTLFSAVDASGKPVGATRVYDPRQDENPWFNLASGILTALAGNVMAGGLIAGGVPSLLAKSGMGYILSGGDEKAALGAGIGSLAAPYIGGAAKTVGEAVGGGTLGDIASRAVSGAGTSALGAAVRGGDIGDIGDAIVAGGLGGATSVLARDITSEILNTLDPTDSLPDPVVRTLRSVVGGAAADLLRGRDVDITKPLVNAALGEIFALGRVGTPKNTATGGGGTSEDADNADILSGFDLPPTEEQTPIFLGENIASGVPAWDASAIAAATPLEGLTANFEPDFAVAQTREGPVITDTAGNRGEFTEGAWDARFDPRAFSDYTAPAQTAQQIEVVGKSLEPDYYVTDKGQIVSSGGDIGRFVEDTFVPQAAPIQRVDVTAPRVTPTAIEPVLNVEDIINTPIDVGPPPDPEVIIGPPPVVTPPPRPAPAPAPAPAPSPAPAPASSNMDWLALLALLGGEERRADPYQVAQIAARSPFGSILDETSQEDLLRILRG
jgi:hypothetical protein